MKKPKVCFAYPAFGGITYVGFSAGLQKAATALAKEGIETEAVYTANVPFLDHARNYCVHNFLKSDATHLLWVDSDIMFEPYHVMKLIEAEKDIIGGLYPHKEINWAQVGTAARAGIPDNMLSLYSGRFSIKFPEGTPSKINIGDVVPAATLHGGFLMINRRVYEELEAIDLEAKDMYYQQPMTNNERIFRHHRLVYAWGRHWPDDFEFCDRAADAGFQPYWHSGVQLQHQGFHIYNGDFFCSISPPDQLFRYKVVDKQPKKKENE